MEMSGKLHGPADLPHIMEAPAHID